MAIIKMKKLKAIGLMSEEKSILDALQYSNLCETVKTSEIERTKTVVDIHKKEEIAAKINQLDFAIGFINEQTKELEKLKKKDETIDFKKIKKPFFFYRNEITFDEFNCITMQEYEIFTKIDALTAFNAKLNDLKAENLRLNNLISSVKIYENLDIKFSRFKDSKNTLVLLGTITGNPQKLEKDLAKIESADYNIVGSNSINSVITLLCHKIKSEEIFKILTEYNFSKCTIDFDCTPKEKLDECETKILQNESERKEIIISVTAFNEHLKDIKLLSDYYNITLNKLEIENEFKRTEKCFILEGFVPVTGVSIVENILLSATNSLEFSFADVEEGDNPPTFTKNIKLVEPFEGVTNLFSVPSYKESDPNLFVAIFFFLFFGIMLSDAGYGLILALGATLILKFCKLETGTRRLVAIIGIGGVSTIIWGIVFGGWFAFDIDGTFLEKLRWFNPLDEPIMMIGLCLGLGVLHILFGIGLKGVALIKEGKILDAVFDAGCWYFFFISVGVLGLSMVLKDAPGTLQKTGLYMLIASLAFIVLTQGRSKKGLIKKFVFGLAGIYNIVNFLSDILSYSRLFGLGVATGVIGMVFNTLAGLMFGSWFLIPLGIIVFLVGHIFNIAINVLGAYVHNSRLQYIEFFSKFYQGGGHVFKPIGAGMKYNVIK